MIKFIDREVRWSCAGDRKACNERKGFTNAERTAPDG